MAETCSPRNIGPSNEPLGCGVSECRLGGRRVSFSCFSFHLGVPWILKRGQLVGANPKHPQSYT